MHKLSSLWQLHSQKKRQERPCRDLAGAAAADPLSTVPPRPPPRRCFARYPKAAPQQFPSPKAGHRAAFLTKPVQAAAAQLGTWLPLWYLQQSHGSAKRNPPRQGACACTVGLQLLFVPATGSGQTPQGDCPHIQARVSPKLLASLSQKQQCQQQNVLPCPVTPGSNWSD